MEEVQAVLTYSPGGLGQDGIVTTVGRTSAPRALRALRDAIIADARDQAAYWQNVDPVLAAMQTNEAENVAKLLALVLPDEDLRPDLKLVPDRNGDR